MAEEERVISPRHKLLAEMEKEGQGYGHGVRNTANEREGAVKRDYRDSSPDY